MSCATNESDSSAYQWSISVDRFHVQPFPRVQGFRSHRRQSSAAAQLPHCLSSSTTRGKSQAVALPKPLGWPPEGQPYPKTDRAPHPREPLAHAQCAVPTGHHPIHTPKYTAPRALKGTHYIRGTWRYQLYTGYHGPGCVYPSRPSGDRIASTLLHPLYPVCPTNPLHPHMAEWPTLGCNADSPVRATPQQSGHQGGRYAGADRPSEGGI